MLNATISKQVMVAAICAVVVGCGGGGGGGGSQKTCDAPAGRLTSGPYIVANDSYVNSEAQLPAHPVTDFTQCASLGAGTTPGTLKASWTWSWPTPTDPTEMITRATPSIIYGFKPWDPQSTTPDLPRLVSNIGKLQVDADVSQTGTAGSASMFGVVAYLTTADHKTGTDPLPFAKRFFVYLNAYPPYGGSGDAQVTIDGIEWDVTSNSYFVLYVPHANQDVPVTSLHVDVAHFLADALGRGAIQPTWYVSSVETAEILTWGTGSLTLDNYKVTFEAQ